MSNINETRGNWTRERNLALPSTLDVEHLEAVLGKLPEPKYVEIIVEPTIHGKAHKAFASLSQEIGFQDRLGFPSDAGNKFTLVDGKKADILKIEKDFQERQEVWGRIRGRAISAAYYNNTLTTRFNRAIWLLDDATLELMLTGLTIKYLGNLPPVVTEINQALLGSGIKLGTKKLDLETSSG